MEAKKVFLPKSCQHCPGEASYDIMTADGQWQMVCLTGLEELLSRGIRAGYKIEVLLR